ncbi:helix-turn-helix domain-containing protein [Anaerosporobacter faecicola]|uniref:helix-turn-helix domain-containing protein n=1 Tax=Anaerosporobacter faecicola TaxID=2718714 RepID=UPI00143BDD5B|nr:helix-turn-helix domain-containing protein [Anaerosporobacter faecicola]
MTERYDFPYSTLLLADYADPKPHKHLASHLMISLGDEMEWRIGEDNVKAKGIAIASNIMHTGQTGQERTMVFLFAVVGIYGKCLERDFLKGKSYAILPDDLVERAIRAYHEQQEEQRSNLPERILSCLGIEGTEEEIYEPRVQQIIQMIGAKETIESDIVEEISKQVCLSKSRLSHLFRKETGMTLHSFLAFEKLVKTNVYLKQGLNITESCMKAGFDSPSHCAATSQKMFGIALREVYKTIATK